MYVYTVTHTHAHMYTINKHNTNLPLVQRSPELFELIEAHLPRAVSVQHGNHDAAGVLAERFISSTYARGCQAPLQLLGIYLSILG